MKKRRAGFTLLELILSILLLVVLWIFSYIKLWWYIEQARDSKRVIRAWGLLNKIVMSNTKWVRLSELIINTNTVSLQVLWEENNKVETFWVANFEALKEDPTKFKDPSDDRIDFPFAYSEKWRVFIQGATISEKEQMTVIMWNYFKQVDSDASSLFKKWDIIYRDEGREMIYEIWGILDLFE